MVLVLAGLVVVVAFTAARNQGWLTPFGVTSESNDSQVVRTIERTQEVSLVSLGIEGIDDESNKGEVFGFELPGTEKTLYLRYSFTAKLGLDGEAVDIEKTGEHSYRLEVPEFSFIGYSDLTFERAVEDNDILSFVSTDVDQSAAQDKILSPGAQAKYLAQNQEVLRDQTEFFFDALITSVDPDATTTYEFEIPKQ